MTSDDTANDIADWHLERFGWVDDRIIGCKLAEETGEICRALIRYGENRGDRQNLLDELGDTLIVLTVLAWRHNTTLGDALEARWATIKGRP